MTYQQSAKKERAAGLWLSQELPNSNRGCEICLCVRIKSAPHLSLGFVNSHRESCHISAVSKESTREFSWQTGKLLINENLY